MDNAFWQSIITTDYAVPAGHTPAELASELLCLLGSPDPELREKVAYETLLTWIERDLLTSDLHRIVQRLSEHLVMGLGTQDASDVFLRSSSAMLLAEIVFRNNRAPFLSQAGVRQLFERALTYLANEHDLRGYAPGYGWVHAVAHAADLLWVLAKNPHTTASDLERLLDVIATRMLNPVAHVYLHDEDEHLVRTVLAVLQRNLVPQPFLIAWIERLAQPWSLATGADRAIEAVAASLPACCARHNTKQFLRSLYFQLMFPGMGGLRFAELLPPSATVLLTEIRAALQGITTWP